MKFDCNQWNRQEHNGVPVYLSRKGASWFVPDNEGDKVLRACTADPDRVLTRDETRFLSRLPDNNFTPYTGRSKPGESLLKELWFHLTDNCNMACRHCLFSSGGTKGPSLDSSIVLDVAMQASNMGCSLFALTGGEPLVHPDITAIVDGLLVNDDAHVVMLTNAKEIASFADTIKRWGTDRFHLQISIDGDETTHNSIRGKGAYKELLGNLALLANNAIPFTLSMAVSKSNYWQMSDVVRVASQCSASSIHFMWHFVRGRGKEHEFVETDKLFTELIRAAEIAEKLNITLDNIETFRAQMFTPHGTLYDGSGAGRDSAAIGSDAKLYPSAATVGIDALATPIDAPLAQVWMSSAVLNQIRTTSVATSDHPWRFYTGGGDFDHSYLYSGLFTGADPYCELYAAMFGWLIGREVSVHSVKQTLSLRLSCGEILANCDVDGAILTTHSNCLLSVAGDRHISVKSFYSDAATEVNEDIVNPICFPESEIAHIPPAYRFRGYGCGSPVIDADIVPGEAVVDLGSGRGIECFIAAKKVGPSGSVTGIDMLDPMLSIANEGAAHVKEVLGYDNLSFKKGFLEALPLESDSTDVILSNCVLNLSAHKRKTFSELFRVLRKGGRIVVSDVVCEEEPFAHIRNNNKLKGECIAGALRQRDLIGLLEETGFTNIAVIKRFPYRIVDSHPFYSMTFSAQKPVDSKAVRVMYRGPGSTLVTGSSSMLLPGVTAQIPEHEADAFGEQLLRFDQSGAVTNIEVTSSCACALPQSQSSAVPARHEQTQSVERQRTGCMVCGESLVYMYAVVPRGCWYCKEEHAANAVCTQGHFICDTCHSSKAIKIIERICMETKETDMLTLLTLIRSHNAVPMHGPEHHGMVPAIILTAYINSGGELPRGLISTAITRGLQTAGGSCGFSGVCGAAAGVGTAFSLILDGNPLKARQRMVAQQAVTEVMMRLSKIDGARCCQRDCTIALTCAADISEKFLGTKLTAGTPETCVQFCDNEECAGADCPFFG